MTGNLTQGAATCPRGARIHVPSYEDKKIPQRLRLYYHVADCTTPCRCSLNTLAGLLADNGMTEEHSRGRVRRAIAAAIHAGLLTEGSQIGGLSPTYKADNTVTITHRT